VLGLVGVGLRRPSVIVLAAAVVGLHAGARAEAEYRQVEPGPFAGPAEVTADPERIGFGRRVELRLPDGLLIQASGHGATGWALEQVSVGDRLMVDGRLTPIGDRPWLKTRHIAGRMTIDRFDVIAGPDRLGQVPEAVRQRIAAGADALANAGPGGRSLYLGLVIGDDRDQDSGQRIRFRAAGLTHLLAVSGQNVAFVLAVARPLLERLGRRRRFAALVGVLAVFAMVTRLEPSVLRATVTAGIAAWAALSGRERSGLIVLSAAVFGLIIIDPFLVDSVGFQLSVAASAGILIAGPAIERRLPGPGWLSGPLATTTSAQLFVSPLLAHYFGPVSVASVPANLLAGWAAAAIMTLGLTVGVVAGLLPPTLGQVLQWPSGVLLDWIDGVATVHARLPAPRIGPVELVVLVALWVGYRARSAPRWGRVTAVIAAGVLLVGSAPTAPSEPTSCGPGIGWYPAGVDTSSVLVVTSTAYERSVEQCFDAGVRHVDVVVLERGGSRTAEVAGALREVIDIGIIVAPPQHRVIGANRQTVDVVLPTVAGPLAVEPSADGRSLEISSRRS
jgi:competence protein ComEC